MAEPPTAISWPVCALCLLFGMVGLAAECANIFFCGPFFYTGIGLVTCFLLFAQTFYRLCSRRINERLFAFASSITLVLGVVVTVIHSIALSCAADGTTNFCTAVFIRSRSITQSCFAALAKVQRVFVLGDATKPESLQSIIHITLLIVGFFEIIISTVVLCCMRKAISLKIKCHQLQIIVGFLLLIPSSLHVAYCCIYFYIGLGFWTAGAAIFAGLAPLIKDWRPERKSCTLTAVANILLILTALLTVALNSFGLYCWMVYHNGDTDLFQRDCRAKGFAGRFNRELYNTCMKDLEERSYANWPSDVMWHDIGRIQFSSYCCIGALSLFLSATGFYMLCKIIFRRFR